MGREEGLRPCPNDKLGGSMKRLIIMALILMSPVSAFCSPFLVCDPQAAITHYKITGDPYWPGNAPAQADGSLKADLGSISMGTHNIQIAACKTDTTWGEVCSATVPFSFTRPAVPQPSGGLKIMP